jgi:hypothetical protein
MYAGNIGNYGSTKISVVVKQLSGGWELLCNK